MDSVGINQSELRNFLSNARGTNALSILGRVYPNLDTVFNHPIGKEILKDDIDRVSELLHKVYLETASPQELAELRYLRLTRIPKIIDRVNSYLKALIEVKHTQTTTKGE